MVEVEAARELAHLVRRLDRIGDMSFASRCRDGVAGGEQRQRERNRCGGQSGEAGRLAREHGALLHF